MRRAVRERARTIAVTDWSDPLEWVKVVGGFTGLATFAYTTLDRIERNRPVCSLIATVDLDGITPELRLRVQNVSSHDIEIVGVDVASTPPAFVLSVESYKRV